MDEPIQTVATQVTFFEDRAQVTRRATVPLAQGRSTVRFAGVTMLVIDPSVLVRIVKGDGRVLTTRVHRVLSSKPRASQQELTQLEARVVETGRIRDEKRAEMTRCTDAARRVEALDEHAVTALQAAPHDVAATDWAAAFTKLEAEYTRLDAEHDALAEDLAIARRDYTRANDRLQQARAEDPELAAFIEVEFDVYVDAPFEVEFTYFTPCALWRPSHIARLSPDRDHVAFTMLGTAWQQTGEKWVDVRCRFSTARPTEAAEAPRIEDDWLNSRPKTAIERQIVAVAARDVDISSTGSELAGRVEEMPGVDDGGEPLLLESIERVTIPSTGEPFRVEVRTTTVACRTDVVAFPEKSNVPYLRARGTWKDEYPILAGPTVIMRGNEYAGRTRIDYTAAGETFELGFGIESGVSIHRTIEDEHKTTAVTGKNILHRTVKVFLSNLSGTPRHLTVIERVPVSEIEEVSVKKVDASSKPDADGFVEYAIELGPRAVKTETLTYRVEYGSKVQLSW